MKRLNLLLACLYLIIFCNGTAWAEQEKSRQLLAQNQKLDLLSAQCIALSGNPSISAAGERVFQARARLRQAMATWWPSVDITASGAHQHLSDRSFALNRRIAAATGQDLDQSSMNYSSGLQATWLLFDGFYRSFNEQRAQAAQLAQEEALNDSRRLLAAAVGQAFLNAQLAQSNIDIAQASTAFYEKQLDHAQRRYDVGAGAWSDVLNIQVQLNNAKATLLGHERELQAAEYGLATLLGLDTAALPLHLQLSALANVAQAAPALSMDVGQLIKEAYNLRPDLRRMEQRLQEADALAGMAKAPLYPQVRIAGALDGQRQDDFPGSSADYGNTIAVNMSWNLYAGGADKARMMEANHIRREMAYSLAALRNEIASDIRASLARLSEAAQQVQLQQATVHLVEENRRLAENAYAEGEYALIQLNEAQRDLTNNAGRLALALISYQSAQQQLLEASGRILEPLASLTPTCQPLP
ncbi:MAG: TolC family protein [Desulfobulbaceae bacterium]|nr:TolC family protein [Desulfobulbaceae bacterium]